MVRRQQRYRLVDDRTRDRDSGARDASTEQKRLFLEEDKKEITKNGSFVKFTKAEYEIFSYLIKRKGFIVSRFELVDEVESISSEDGGSIAVIINRIRTKIEVNPKQPKYLQTIRGMGYKLVDR